jgi:hypothetical protein
MAKGETIMPVPGGEITTTELWQAPVEETVEEVVEDSIIYMDIELPTESEKVPTIGEMIKLVEEDEDDLPELS